MGGIYKHVDIWLHFILVRLTEINASGNGLTHQFFRNKKTGKNRFFYFKVRLFVDMFHQHRFQFRILEVRQVWIDHISVFTHQSIVWNP